MITLIVAYWECVLNKPFFCFLELVWQDFLRALGNNELELSTLLLTCDNRTMLNVGSHIF